MTQLLPNDPSRWGPHAWEFLYCTAFMYPHKPTKDEQKHMLRFLKSMKDILPCPTCRENYRRRIRHITKQNLESKKALVLWLMNIKNEIAKVKGTKLDTYVELTKKYHLDKLDG
jgi:hypothetical protein